MPYKKNADGIYIFFLLNIKALLSVDFRGIHQIKWVYLLEKKNREFKCTVLLKIHMKIALPFSS